MQIAALNSLRHENIVQFLGVAGAMPDCFLVSGASHYVCYYCKRELHVICLSKAVFLLVTKSGVIKCSWSGLHLVWFVTLQNLPNKEVCTTV